MQVESINHCSVSVIDAERAANFYKTVLGLVEVESAARTRWFLAGNQQIHLLLEGMVHDSTNHFALNVRSLNDARKRLVEHGVEILEADPIPGVDRLFLKDTEGNLIELVEMNTF